MIYAGIDVAKLNHFASVISSDGEVLVEPFKFSNDFEGFRSLSLVLDKYDREQLLVGLESTAHYGNNLVEFLVAKGYRFCVLNPIQTSAMRKGNIRNTKTDKVDTFVIAKTLMSSEHRLFALMPSVLFRRFVGGCCWLGNATLVRYFLCSCFFGLMKGVLVDVGFDCH